MSGSAPETPGEVPRSGVPRAARSVRAGGALRDGVPAGWPPGVPPPDAPGWERAAVAWLLDQCPADYRLYEPLRRHPAALAWLAANHVAAQVEAARESYRRARVELGESLGPGGVTEVLGVLEREGLRLRAAARATDLLAQALAGGRFIPRL
ncbi:MAG: hypothetical protein M9891_08135 [Austwickia sp.]|nr:hypothetical protein [Austwickia sp.]